MSPTELVLEVVQLVLLVVIAARVWPHGVAAVPAEVKDGAAPHPPAAPAGVGLEGWVVETRQDVLIEGLLDEWTDAAVRASSVGWVLQIPTGDTLLEAWARTAQPTSDPAESFARWLVTRLGLASRRGLDDRLTVERRDAVSRVVFAAAARLVRGLDPSLEVDPAAPLGVGPRHRHQWLVDEALAVNLDNEPVGGVLQPVVVLRPQLRRGDTVLLEGEVA